ncbi:MAG: response regulator [Candidatus Brocadiales bacterium]
MIKIMIVDDEAVITVQLEERLESMGYEVVGTASSGEESISMARRLRPHLILMDIVMPGKLDGVSAAEIIKAELDIPVIFLTAHVDGRFVERAREVGSFGYIVKPFSEEGIRAAIEIAFYKNLSEQSAREAYHSVINKLVGIVCRGNGATRGTQPGEEYSELWKLRDLGNGVRNYPPFQ